MKDYTVPTLARTATLPNNYTLNMIERRQSDNRFAHTAALNARLLSSTGMLFVSGSRGHCLSYIINALDSVLPEVLDCFE